MRALVLDPGGSRSALAGCRALAHAGWEVGIAASGPTFTGRSRAVREVHRVPAVSAGGVGGYVSGVAAAVDAGGYDVVVPAGDAEAFAVSLGRNGIGCQVPYGPHAVVARALDKAALADVAGACGVAVPGSRSVDDVGPDDLPVVVKGRSHVGQRREAVVVRTMDEFRRACAEQGDVVVQEFVEGPLVALSVVADSSSAVVARVQQRAVTVWPVPAGVSTRAVTVAVDARLSAAVDALVSALEWQGLAQFQFLIDGAGVPRLIDCNGRLYGSLSLALAAGVNLAALWVGGDSERTTARAGHRYQWLEGDVRRSPREAWASVMWGLRAQHSIISATDPAPAVAYGLSLAQRAVRKAVRR